MRNYLAAGVFLAFFGFMPFVSHSADVPEEVTLSATKETVTVEWTRDSEADSYEIFWDTNSDNPYARASVDDPVTPEQTMEYTITGLSPDTEYFVQLRSVENGERSSWSSLKSITTEADTEPPAMPEGFDITGVSQVQKTSAEFEWEENTETDLESYKIYYGTTSGNYSGEITVDAESTVKQISGLDTSTRYYFTIAAIDESGNESETPAELIVDTLPDSLAPDPPEAVSATLVGAAALEITVESGNEQMVDFKGSNIYYGTTSGNYDYCQDIGDDGSYAFSTLPEDKQTWFFNASAYDQTGNESAKTDEISVQIEDVSGFLEDSDDFDGGCFISTLGGGPLMKWALAIGAVLLGMGMAVGRIRGRGVFGILLLLLCLAAPARAGDADESRLNTIGLTAGYYVAQDSDYEDFYDDDSFPVSAFYDRRLSRRFSLEIKAGFWRDTGHLLTESGSQTGIGSEMEVVPASVSLKIHFPLADAVSGYIGAGPSYWYVKEEPDIDSVADVDEWVGGYHGKIGLMLYNSDEKFAGTGALIETSYSVIDRFGDNEIDMGGWITELGFFFQF